MGCLGHHRKQLRALSLQVTTYGHQICTIGVYNMGSPNNRVTPSLTYFPRSQGQNVKIKYSGNNSGTICNPCTQTLIILHA